MRGEVEKSRVRRIRSGLPKKERILAKFHLTFERSTTGKLPVHLALVWDGGRYEKDMVLHGLASHIESWLREVLQCSKHRIDSAHLYFHGEKDGAMLEVVFLGKIVCISILGFSNNGHTGIFSVNRKDFMRQVRSMYDYLRTEEWQDGCRALEEREFTEFSTVPDCEAPETVLELEADRPNSIGWHFSVDQIRNFCDAEFVNGQEVRSFFEELARGEEGFHFLSMPSEFYCDYFKVWVRGETSRVQLCCISNSGAYKHDHHMTVRSDGLREQAEKVLAVLT